MEDEDDVRSIEDGLFADEAEEVSGSENETSDKNDDEKKIDGDEDKDTDAKKRMKPKKTGPVKRVLLHEDMLCGSNGLTKLEDVFKDFKFRGRGYETEDLDQILIKLEHWVHNLYPRYPFGQTLERIEFLGMKKKILKTHVKKIRMGLISSFNTMDEDNLPDIVDSDVEMEQYGNIEENSEMRLNEEEEHNIIIEENSETHLNEEEEYDIIGENSETPLNEEEDTGIIGENSETHLNDEEEEHGIIGENSETHLNDEEEEHGIIGENSESHLNEEEETFIIIGENNLKTHLNEEERLEEQITLNVDN